MPRRLLLGAGAVAVTAMLLASASAQEQRVSGSTLMSWPISPAVVATFIAHGDPITVTPRQPLPIPRSPQTGPVTLDLLVLWRGAPGWFMQGDHNQVSGGGDSRGHVSVHLERGGHGLDVMLDAEKRAAEVAGIQVALGDANVVLVDGVDVPGGLTISGTRAVEPRIERPPAGLYDVFRGAPDLVPFLRCEARVPVPPAPKEVPAGASTAIAGYLQRVLDDSCARIQGR